MPSFQKKDGSKGFHMNPQTAKVMSSAPHKAEASAGGKMMPDAHENMGSESAKLANYNGHDFNGHQLAHHMELHHGGHPAGEPPPHEGTTHHTIAHPHPEHGGEPEIRNHDSAEEAHGEENDAMHEGCPECDQGSADDGMAGMGGSISDVSGAGDDE